MIGRRRTFIVPTNWGAFSFFKSRTKVKYIPGQIRYSKFVDHFLAHCWKRSWICSIKGRNVIL